MKPSHLFACYVLTWNFDFGFLTNKVAWFACEVTFTFPKLIKRWILPKFSFIRFLIVAFTGMVFSSITKAAFKAEIYRSETKHSRQWSINHILPWRVSGTHKNANEFVEETFLLTYLRHQNPYRLTKWMLFSNFALKCFSQIAFIEIYLAKTEKNTEFKHFSLCSS